MFFRSWPLWALRAALSREQAMSQEPMSGREPLMLVEMQSFRVYALENEKRLKI